MAISRQRPLNGAVKVEGILLVANRPSLQLQTLSSYSKFHSRTSRPRNVVKTSLRTTKSQQIKRSSYAPRSRNSS